MKILVTGTNGFVGRSLCAELFRQDLSAAWFGVEMFQLRC